MPKKTNKKRNYNRKKSIKKGGAAAYRQVANYLGIGRQRRPRHRYPYSYLFRNRIGSSLVRLEKNRHLTQMRTILRNRKNIRFYLPNKEHQFNLGDILSDKEILELAKYKEIIQAIYNNNHIDPSIYKIMLSESRPDGNFIEPSDHFIDDIRDITVTNLSANFSVYNLLPNFNRLPNLGHYLPFLTQPRDEYPYHYLFINQTGSDLVGAEKHRHLQEIARILESRKRIRFRFLSGNSFTLNDILDEKEILELTRYRQIIEAINENKKKNDSIKSIINDRYIIALVGEDGGQLTRGFNDNKQVIDIINRAPPNP